MKVELDKIILGYSPLSESIFAGIPLTNGTWRHKIDVTQPFIDCVIRKFGGGVTSVTDGESEWEITVKKVK